MAPPEGWNDVLALVATEHDSRVALDGLIRAAAALTGCRNAMIARMNDELGCLELAHGTGAEWSETRIGERLKLRMNREDGIVAFVAATGQTYLTGDVRKEPRYKNLFDTTVSELAVAVRDSHGRMRGVVNLESDRADAFDNGARRTAEGIALLAGIAIDREDAQIREEALVEVGSSLDSAMTQEELVERVIAVAGEVLRFQAFSVFLLDRKSGLFVLRGSVGQLEDEIGRIGYQLGEGLTGWVCETGRSIRLASPQSDAHWRGLHVEFPSAQIASFLAVPIVSRGQSIGVLRAIRRTTANALLDNTFGESDERLLKAIAEQIAAGLESIRNVEKLVQSERIIAWGELSAKSSHMIGNRVFALKGDVNELGHLIEEPQPSREQLAEIQQSLATNVRRVEEILQDFRDFVTATQLELQQGDLNDLVRQTLREVAPRGGRAPIEMDLDEGLPGVNMDANKLQRALAELIENALSFSPEGNVCVETGLATADEVRGVRKLAGQRMVRLCIADTGPGVPDEKKRQIFQPFYSSRVKGMGLGLSIVQGIVEGHGGTVYEAGLAGSGARFVILLPAAKRQKKVLP